MPSAPPSYEEACKHQAPNYGAAPPSQGYAPYMPQTAGYPAVGPYQQIPLQQHPQVNNLLLLRNKDWNLGYVLEGRKRQGQIFLRSLRPKFGEGGEKAKFFYGH